MGCLPYQLVQDFLHQPYELWNFPEKKDLNEAEAEGASFKKIHGKTSKVSSKKKQVAV